MVYDPTWPEYREKFIKRGTCAADVVLDMGRVLASLREDVARRDRRILNRWFDQVDRLARDAHHACDRGDLAEVDRTLIRIRQMLDKIDLGSDL